MTVEDIRGIFIDKLENSEFNNQGLLEIHGASFVATENTIFGKPNLDYIERELNWYRSKSRYVSDLRNTPKIWNDIASVDGKINSNYGWCIYSKDNYTQYSKVLQHLRDNPNTRQAEMIYIRPTMHEDSVENGMRDFMCTNAVIYSISNGKVNCVVQMRSNDAVYGYKNDYAWQKYVLDELSRDLNLTSGEITWQVANLHIYPRHFHLVSK